MKKILMIGAGIGQLYLSRRIKERGEFLICVTLPGNQPVIDIADKVYYIDVFDKEGVLNIAREEKIDAVISDQNDLMMPTVAYVSEKMSLPGLRIGQVNAYCNKNVFRNNCDALNIPAPKHVDVRNVIIPDEFYNIPFPWMVKPADSQSSVGVRKVNNKNECLEALEDALYYSKSKSAIIEEFFTGKELVAEGFIYKGKYYNLGFADRKYFNIQNIFIPSQTIFPSVAPNALLQKINTCEERMANYIKPDFAIVHSEYLYNEETREYRVVESAIRGGGVYISSHIIPLFTGIDINDTLIKYALGQEVNVNEVFKKRINKAAGYVCFYLPEGIIRKADGLTELKKLDCVKMMCVDEILVGTKTSPLTHKGQRLGPIIVTGDNREDLEKNIKSIQNILCIVVEDNHGKLRSVIWE